MTRCIIIFGDSITQGFWDTERAGWANRLHAYAMQKSIESNFDKYIPVYVLGISGDTLPLLLERFDVEFERRCEDGDILTIFAYGINDSMSDKDGTYATALSDFKQHYVSLIQKASLAGRVALVGLAPIDESQLDPIPWFPKYSYLESGRIEFDKAVREIAEENDCLFISMDNVFGVDTVSKTVGGIHPNAEGHQLMFERIKTALSAEGVL